MTKQYLYFSLLKTLILSILVAFINLVHLSSQSNPLECFIPDDFEINSRHSFDLNGDNLRDSIFIIKGTKKSQIIKNRFGDIVDRNRRGILIFFKNVNGFDLITKNLDCFSSENEDGGVYMPPELSVEQCSPNCLRIHYDHGRYGHWGYKFKYQDAHFKLSNYYSAASTSGSTAFYQLTNIDVVNQLKHISTNIDSSGIDTEEKYVSTTENCLIKKEHLLSKIKDFHNLKLCD